MYILQQYPQGLPWTSLEQFSQAVVADPPHPIAFHHEQLEPCFKIESLRNSILHQK